jgi:small subunit ribosomal protein S7
MAASTEDAQGTGSSERKRASGRMQKRQLLQGARPFLLFNNAEFIREGHKMPRRGFIPKRDVLPDPVYGTQIVTKLINQIMYDGKRGVAQTVCYEAFDMVAQKTGKEASEVFDAAIANIMPSLEVKARRVGGTTYQVPIEIRPERRQTLALRWLVSFARRRGERSMSDRLAGEILDAANNAGNAVKRREDMHKMAEANKAFAHYRW